MTPPMSWARQSNAAAVVAVALALFAAVAAAQPAAAPSASAPAPAPAPAAPSTRAACAFMLNSPRYYQLTAEATLQGAGADTLVNDALLRALRAGLSLASCQLVMSQGEACASGTPALPCADPLFYCDGGMVLAADVYAAVASGDCAAPGSNDTLVCAAIAANPAIGAAVGSGTCKPACAVAGAAAAAPAEEAPADCLSYTVTVNAPTEAAAQAAGTALSATDLAGSLGGAAAFSVVSADIKTVVGFGFFPPPPSPPPPPPPLKQLSPAGSAGLAAAAAGGGGADPDGGGGASTATLALGPWSNCSAACGQGFSIRSATCTSPDGALLSLGDCPEAAQAQVSQPCTSQCAASYWTYSAWGACSAACGGGTATRQAACQSADGAACDAAAEATTAPCNTAPCATFVWVASAWGECSAACGGGTRSRAVRCVGADGAAVAASFCAAAQAPPAAEACAAQPCDFCQGNACLGRGACQANACACRDGYSGPYCESAPSCRSAVVDANLACCPSGLVDTAGTCCPEGAVLDGAGQCCAQEGGVDACGACGGAAALVDMQGACCAAADANGVCCPSGAVDECGVCDGVGNTCGVRVVASVAVPASLVMGDAVQDGPINAFFAGAAAAMGLPEGSLAVADISMQAPPAAGRRRLAQQGDALVPLDVILTVNATTNLTGDARLSAPLIAAQLPAAAAGQSAATGVQLGGAPAAVRTAVCGNGVCEVGERSAGGALPGTCPADCGLPAQPCPGGCGAGGACLPASGACRCFLGYAGASCGECAEGFSPSGAACTTSVVGRALVNASVVDSAGAALVSGEVEGAGGGGASVGVIAGAVIGGVALLAALVVGVCCCRGRAAYAAEREAGAYGDRDRAPHGTSAAYLGGSGEGEVDEELGLRQKYGGGAANSGRGYHVHAASSGGAAAGGPPLRAHSLQAPGAPAAVDALRHSTHSLPAYDELERRASARQQHQPAGRQFGALGASADPASSGGSPPPAPAPRPNSAQSSGAIDPGARLFFNPAYLPDGAAAPSLTASVAQAYVLKKQPLSARGPPNDKPAAAAALRRVNSTGEVAAAAGGGGGTLEERRAKLRALRSAISHLEAARGEPAGAAGVAAAPPPDPEPAPAPEVPAKPDVAPAPPAAPSPPPKPASFLPGRPAVPRLHLANMADMGKKRPLQRPAWAGPSVGPSSAAAAPQQGGGLIAAHPGDGAAPRARAPPAAPAAAVHSKVSLQELSARAAAGQADPRYSTVLAAVEGALRSAGTSPTKIPRPEQGSPARIPRPGGARRD